MRTALPLCAAAAALLAASACGSGRRDDGSGRSTRSTYPADSSETPRTTEVDVDRVTDVTSDEYPSRTYFYDGGDSGHVYWFEPSSPTSWTYRPVYRSGSRSYYLEQDGRAIRRVYFDDLRARAVDWNRDSRWTQTQRDDYAKAARDEWARRERDEAAWRRRWDERHPTER